MFNESYFDISCEVKSTICFYRIQYTWFSVLNEISASRYYLWNFACGLSKDPTKTTSTRWTKIDGCVTESSFDDSWLLKLDNPVWISSCNERKQFLKHAPSCTLSTYIISLAGMSFEEEDVEFMKCKLKARSRTAIFQKRCMLTDLLSIRYSFYIDDFKSWWRQIIQLSKKIQKTICGAGLV